MRMFLRDRGFTMIELVVSIGVMSVAILAVLQLSSFSDKRTKKVTDEIQQKILELGAEKFISTDIASSFPGYNYLNVKDDSNKSFYSYNKDFICNKPECGRTITLKLGESEIESSKMFYLITLRGKGGEKLVYEVDPTNVFESNSYRSMNDTSNININFSKSNIPYSPWEEDRLLLLSSNISMYDCLTGIIGETTSCSFTCPGAVENCNHSLKRKFKMLGIVNSTETELVHYKVSGNPTLFNSKYKPCRQNSSGGCSSPSIFGGGVSFRSKNYYENLPYLPGFNNNTYFQPVELVRYVLRRDSASKSNKRTKLIRETATFVGSKLKFTKKFTVLIGLESIVFKRVSAAAPSISFKIKKLSSYNGNI